MKFLLLLFFFPIATHAQTTFRTLVGDFIGMINVLVPIIIGLALVFFLWGLLIFITQSGDEETARKGKTRMLWGVIGLFVMVAVWGLVRFVGSTLGII
jgi:hypothetical protein